MKKEFKILGLVRVNVVVVMLGVYLGIFERGRRGYGYKFFFVLCGEVYNVVLICVLVGL